MIRRATLNDIPALAEIESICFNTDRLSKRQFRYMLTKAHAVTLVLEEVESILGYVLVLFSSATSMGRLYSIAVRPEQRGRGIARKLVLAAEEATRAEERSHLRLEIRKDNEASIGLFKAMGYKRFGELSDYYEDHMDGWRFQKVLTPGLKPEMARVPYYQQTLDFTCGAASLMMAMKSLKPELPLDRKLEFRLWREATTIFMTSGHGGCGPYGVALAAARRGFRVEVHVSESGVHLIDSVRDEQKKEVMRLVQEDQADQLASRGVPILHSPLNIGELEERFRAGAIPIVLISFYAIYGWRIPHWVVITGFDEHFVYVNDPFVDDEQGETITDSINIPISRRQFAQMARYGKQGLKAAVLLYAPDSAAG